jgi:hypothetical protein
MSSLRSRVTPVFLLFTLLSCTAVLHAQTVLSADGNTDTYTLITNALAPGATPYEVPDQCDPANTPHIRQAFDAQRGHYVFQSFIHLISVDPVTGPIDCDPSTGDIDRQRNEIKTYAPSPAYLKASPGDTVTYRWKFKLDSGFQCSKDFTHIHQIKAVNGNDSNPVITFTCEINSSGTPQFQLRYVDDSGNLTMWKTLTLSTSGLLGAWVEAYEKITFNTTVGVPTGSYSVTLTRVSDGKSLLNVSKTGVDLLRSNPDPTNPTFYRPKWGIYRSVASYTYLRDEVVLFDHFCLAKGTDDCLAVTEGPDFGLSTMQTSQTVSAGNSTNFTTSVTPGNSFSGTVALTATGLPVGANASFSPASVTGGSGSSTLAINTNTSVTPGTYTVTITGTSGSLQHIVTVGLTVTATTNQPPVAANVGPVSVNSATPTPITLTATDGNSDSLTYSVVSGPSHGTLGSVSGNSVIYTSNSGYFGSDSFVFKANDGTADSNVATVAINVTIPAGLITINKSSLTFADTTLNTGSSSLMVTLFNRSSVGISVTPSVTGDFMISGNSCTGTVAPGGTQCNVWVRFTPKSLGPLSGTLTINYSGEAAPLTVSVGGNGGAQLVLSTTSMTFPSTTINGGSSSLMVNLLNRTGAAVTLSPSTTGDFMVSGNACPASLAPDTSCNVWVRFTPKSAGNLTGTLSINANGNLAGTVALSGTGAGSITLNKTAMVFGPVTVGQGSSSQMVTLFNNSGAGITVTPSIDVADFMVSGSSCTGTVAAGGTQCNIWVRFTPKSVSDTLTGTLTINANGNPVGTVSLSGSGN